MIVRSQFKKWKWKFQRKHVFFLPFDVGNKTLTILSSTGNALVVAKNDRLTINRHYHFDGATCAPDFKKVLNPTALHDAMLQLADKYPDTITYDLAHEAFKEEMIAWDFRLWPVYYYAVKLYFNLNEWINQR